METFIIVGDIWAYILCRVHVNVVSSHSSDVTTCRHTDMSLVVRRALFR